MSPTIQPVFPSGFWRRTFGGVAGCAWSARAVSGLAAAAIAEV
jgi:hypothetical protein